MSSVKPTSIARLYDYEVWMPYLIGGGNVKYRRRFHKGSNIAAINHRNGF